LPECIDVQMAVLMKKKYLEFCQPRDGGTPEAAMALYDQALALELKPEFRPAVFLSRAELWRKRGQPAKAMEDYAKAVELAAANEQLRPVYADMLNGIACRLLAEAGGGAMAVTVAEKACALQKKAEFLDTVARAQAETGDFAKAAQTEREAAQLAKDEPQQAAVFELRADGFGEKLAVGKQVERTKSLWLSLAAKEAPARKAWREVMECYRPPMLPVEWEWKSPSNEATAAWNQKRAAQLVAGADLAKQFYVRFSDDQTMRQARFYEVCFLNKAFILGEKKVRDRLVALEQEMLKDSGAPAEDKRAIRRYPVERVLLEVPFNEDEAVKLARGAVADFPEDQEAWTLFIRIALQSNRSREAMVNEAKESKVGKVILDAARQRTGGVWLDNPISLRFTALDGREVDLAKMRGKVVLLFFWATWAPPAVRWELPKILPVYEELNSKGFDVIGISCDEDKGQLQQFVTDKKLPWPQHFDGKRSYEILAKYDIKQIPTLWLVDKKGILRDVNGREGLEEKVKRLLAE
jgi:peroxiredoxin/tetratricopeptide (TPR) repeat protein